MYILFLLFLTILVFSTLFKSFGFTMNQEKEQAVKNFVNKISSDNTVDGQIVRKEGIFSNDTKEKTNVNNLKTIYNNYTNKKNAVFDKELFLKSSEKAVTIILDYFSNENLDFLKNLLTDNMYKTFEKHINENKENKIRYKTVVLSIVSKEIVDIADYDTKIRVKFSMEQFNYVEDYDGNLISGSKDKVQNISEIWTFVKSQNNMWLLNSIE